MSEISTIDELTAWIEKTWPCEMGAPHRFAPTGEPYVVIGFERDVKLGHSSNDGTVREGSAVADFESEERAVIWAMAALKMYAQGRRSTLYWRIKPELSQNFAMERYRVYMRLLISDKPKLPEFTPDESGDAPVRYLGQQQVRALANSIMSVDEKEKLGADIFNKAFSVDADLEAATAADPELSLIADLVNKTDFNI